MRNWFGRLIGVASVLACSACGVGTAPRTPLQAFTNIDAPATAAKGRPVTATLFLWNSNGCTGGPKARATVDEVTRTVTFTGDVGPVEPGSICTQAIVNTPMPVSFTPTQAGTYTLKVRISPNRMDRRGYDHLVPPLEPGVQTTPQDVTLILQVTE